MRAAVVYEFGGPTIHMENVARPFLGKDADATSVPMEVKATGVCRSDRHAHQGHDGDVCVCETTRTVLTLRPGDRVAVPFLLGCGTCECTHTIQASRGDRQQEQVRQPVRDATPDQQGLDISIDAAGFAATCENAVHCCRPTADRWEATHRPHGVGGWKGWHGFDGPKDLPALLKWVSERLVDPSKLVGHRVSLRQGRTGHYGHEPWQSLGHCEKQGSHNHVSCALQQPS
jgi:hypothetical protein